MRRRKLSPDVVQLILGIVGILMICGFCLTGHLSGYW